MSKSKVYEPVATGSTAARDLRDRFADVVNVKDYGAMGDGVTDDTGAFTAAGAVGHPVYVPAGSYKITSAVTGDFFCHGDVLIDHRYISIRDVYTPYHDFPHGYVFNTALTDLGGDRQSSAPDTPYNFGQNMQGAFVDPYEKVLVITHTPSGSGAADITFFHWDEDPRKRTLIKKFDNGGNGYYDFVDHQETCLYRPSMADSPKIVCRGNYYTASGVTSQSNTLTAHVVDFEYPTADSASFTWSVSKVFQMFPLTDWYDASTAANKCRFCVSADGKLMIARAKKRSDDKWYYRIWSLPLLLSKYATTSSSTESPTDISGDYMLQFEERYIDGTNYTQGIFSDGTWIFNLFGSSSTTKEYRVRYDGIFNGQSGVWKGIHAVPAELSSLGITKMEAESIFFAPYNGRMEMVVGVTCVGTNGKYNRYLSPTVSVHGNTATQNQYVSSEDEDVHGFYKQDLGFDMNGTAPSEGRLGGFWHLDKNGRSLGALYSQVSKVSNGSGNYSFWTWNIFDNYLSGSTRRGFSLRFFSANAGGNASFGPWPNSDADLSGNINLGRSDRRWQDTYCEANAWSTSDERIKDNIEDIDEAVFRAWGKVNFKVFQMKDAIEKKGEDARLHVGVIAQQVAEAFASEGLDASRYGLFGHDTWDAEYDEHGNLVREAGDIYGIRYGEALALECAYLRWRLGKMTG